MKDILFRHVRLTKVPPLLPDFTRMRLSDDLRAAIEPPANSCVQPPAIGVTPGDQRKAIGLIRAGCKSETGRPPRALTDTECTGPIESIQHCGNVAAHETRPALDRGKIVAKTKLQFLDGTAKVNQVLFRQRREGFHQDQTTKVRSIGLGHARQSCHRRSFFGPMHALTLRVKNHQHTPMTGQRQMADDRSGFQLIATAAINDQTAAGEKTDADP